MTIIEPRISAVPDRIDELTTIATNLWWSWNRDAQNLFRSIDAELWHRTKNNPIELLRLVESSRLLELAEDEEFVREFDRVQAQFELAVSGAGGWFQITYPDLAARPVAYFCAEFGLHHSVPIYSGGLGVLAGDHCKAASDLGVPLVCVGLLYRKGFFSQGLTTDGWQEDSDDPLDFPNSPLFQLRDENGTPHVVTVPMSGRTLHIGAWRMMVGSVPVYLLDTDLEENDPEDRQLTHKLYTGGPEMRVRQEWVLGVGGVRMLHKLGVDPAAWHANEGHAAFMLVERVRELLANGQTLDDAVSQVRSTSTFTTHTPVPAGHDVFTGDQIERCVQGYFEDDGELSRETFFSFGKHAEQEVDTFHMTVASLRLAGRVNGVSKLHGQETRRMWRALWPEKELEDLPIVHVTNGVHLATWMAGPIMDLFDRGMGPGWGARLGTPELLESVLELDAADLWEVHRGLKNNLLEQIREEAQNRSLEQSDRLETAGTLLNPDALTIGFARRFATYKRADLVFFDADRLREIVTDSSRPVQFVFSGKAHPADDGGKRIMQRIFQFANSPEFKGRIAFLEGYDMHVAQHLVRGVDLWLNLPRVPLEACGTSGMKAGLNGVPQLGTKDGWWAEGFNGDNGWCIPPGSEDEDGAREAAYVYDVLKTEIVPRFFERNERGIPLGWVDTMRHCIKETLERFTARTMVSGYASDFYVPSMQGREAPTPPTAL